MTHLRSKFQSGCPPDEYTIDVTEEKLAMKSSSDSMTSDESLVWLSDSWKYNTIKRAPEFNIFELCFVDQGKVKAVEDRDPSTGKNNEKNIEKKTSTKEKAAIGKGDSARKREMTLEKGKKILRSKLPLFRWKSDKQNSDKDHKHEKNKTQDEPVVKPGQTSVGVLKPDKKRARNTPDLPESPASIHRSKIQKPMAGNASLGLNDFLQRAEKEDAALYKADGEGGKGGGVTGEKGGASNSPAERQSPFLRTRIYKMAQNEMENTPRSPSSSSAKSRLVGKLNKSKQTGEAGDDGEGERNGRGNMSLDVQSCGSTLISAGQHRPSPSPQMAQRVRAKGGETVPSIPSPSSISTTSSTSSSSTSSTSSFLPPILSPNPSGGRGKTSQKTRRGKVPLDSIPFVLSSSSSSSSLSSSSLTNLSSSSSVEYEGDNNQDEPHGSLNSKRKSSQHLLKRSEEKKREQTSCTLSPQINSPCPRLSDPRRKVCKVTHPTSVPHSRTPQNDLEGTHTGSDSNSVSRDTLKHHRQQQHPIKLHPDKKSPASGIALRQETPKHEGRKTKEGKEREEDMKRAWKRETEFQKTYSPMSPHNTISKKDRRYKKTENDNDADDDEGDKRTADRETRRRDDAAVAAASLASRDTGNFAPPPESSWESKRSPTSRKALRELRYSNNTSRCQRPLPSPSPSCPPSGEDRPGPHTNQYHSLPQLYLGNQDLSQSHQPVERNQRFDASASKPYYMSDLYRTSIPGISRNRRYSQTSLIDQALESLELSSLTDSECDLPVPSQDYLQRTNQRHDTNWISSSRRSSTIATSPVLPPLPAGVLDRVSPEPKKTVSTSPEDETNLASVCILSFDLTLDCEELSNNGFNVVNITNSVTDETVLEDTKSVKNRIGSSPSCEDNIRELDDEDTFEVPEDYLMEEIEDVNCEKEDSVSNRSLSLSIDDKYFENDDYDNIEDISCDFISEREQDQHSVTLLPEKQENDMSGKVYEKGIAPDGEDFIEIDCDVKPMETLKRPLVYGYGTGPVRSMTGKPFIEKRFSLASDYSDYMEMNILESLRKQGTSEEVRKKSESCMNLRETYWDYWQAKQGIKGPPSVYSSSESPNNCSSKGSSCPSDRFCYDPEVLLAHVRCPKSLEDATFRQYSACVKSHIHDYFGNVQQAMNEYGLSMPHQNWISSQPDLLPNTPKHTQLSDIPLDYSSEPELPTGSERNLSYRMPPHQYPKRVPPTPLPNTLQKRDLSQDSGTWTYLQSSHESALDASAVGAYPVPLPRSASSLSQIVPNTYNPWQHLLSDVTPPRTPRHSIYSTAKGLVSQSASPSPSRRAHSSTKVTCETNMSAMASHHGPTPTQSSALAQMPQQSSPGTPNKRSFFPSLSKVVKSPLKRPNQRQKTIEKENSIDVLSELPVVHPSIQKRTHTTTSSKSSSSSSSSSSASSKDSVTTVIPASAWNKGPNWLMKHFGGARSKMAAV
ncbi:uncharacterized protein [Palaemon carinicauda]|uniref:uncharacterized protein n=1 Tax=Palaemon carinicauda TaxID=392227 RepID=UPI0035B5F605